MPGHIDADRRIIPAGGADYKQFCIDEGAEIIYMLDEASGNFVDSSGNGGPDHTPYGSPTRSASGLIDGYDCTAFNGSTQYGKNTTNNANLNNSSYTLSVVLRITSLAANATFWHFGNAWASNQQGVMHHVRTGGDVRVQYFVGTWYTADSDTSLIAVDTTIHLVITVDYSAGDIIYYKNGSKHGATISYPAAEIPSTNAGSMIAAYGTNSFALPFPGKIAGIAQFPGAVWSASKVSDLFDTTGI